MKRATVIIAVLFALIATPALAKTSLTPMESENAVYLNASTGEVWGVMIFNAGTANDAEDVVNLTDDDFIEENMEDIGVTVLEQHDTTDADAEDVGFDHLVGFDVRSDLGKGFIAVGSVDELVYTFMAFGPVDTDDFAEFTVGVITTEEMPARTPAGFIKG